MMQKKWSPLSQKAITKVRLYSKGRGGTTSCGHEFHTRDPKYRVNYATSDSPLGPFVNAENHPVLKGMGVVKGAGHHSVVKLPNKDEWYIAYHRFRIPRGDGYHRETCISPMRFDKEGNIMPVDVFEKIEPVKVKLQKNKLDH